MIFFFINQSVKINCSILKINYDLNINKLITKFVLNLELKTKLLIFIGSLSFVFFYYFFLFFLSKRIQSIIFQTIPLVNKVFNFYRKIILITYYEEDVI